jgi:hypothetical protein
LSRRIIVLGALLALLLFGASGAGGTETFTDPQGDAVGGAADITQVDVSNDFDGNVTFTLTIPDRTALTPDDRLFVFLNVDKDSATGFGGLDFAIVIDSEGATLVRAAGSSFAPAPHTTLTVTADRKALTISRDELGDTRGFLFVVLSALDSSDSAEDMAPDTGTATYNLNLKPVLDTLVAHFSPAKPKHGKPFRLSGTALRVEDGTVVKADSITCVAKLNGKRLAGRCSWRIPVNARGKRLVVTLTARYEGASATFTPWRFRVG